MRIKSILEKYSASGRSAEGKKVFGEFNETQKNLMLELVKFEGVIKDAYEGSAPHKICAYIYDISNAFNRFYHEVNIMAEEDAQKQAGYIKLLDLTKRVLEQCIELLGFGAPDYM